MAMNSQIVLSAYRRVGIVAADEPMTAEQQNSGLDELRAMVRSWETWGIKAGPGDFNPDEAFPLPEMFEDGSATILAGRLAEMHGLPGPDGREALNRMIALTYQMDEAEVPLTLRRTDPVRRLWSGY